MNSEIVKKLLPDFEQCAQISEEGVEFWYARDLQRLLDYKEWRNFELVLEKAKSACKNANGTIIHQFVDVNKMIPTGKGAQRAVRDIMLTRYACYLVAQNGDPRKEDA